jgi:hypothetical protein
MGYAKNNAQKRHDDSASGWAKAAKINDYRCMVCGEIPLYEEREIYFETKLCAPHAYRAQKDD